jgi:serine/threonine protein kinase
MSLVYQLIGFGLRQVLGDGVETVVETVEQRFRDHSQTLPRALERAHDRSWQALGVALAGTGFFDRVKLFFASGEDKGVREQVAAFIQGNAVSFEQSPAGFRQACLEDLQRLRKSGLLTAQGLRAADVARQVSGFRKYTDAQGLVEGAQDVVGRIADDIREGYANLARLLATPTPTGPPLLAAAFAYFFRREVETDDELAHGLFFDGLRHLAAAQATAFREVHKALSTLGDNFDAVFEHLGRIEAVAVQTQATASATHGAVLDLQTEMQGLKDLHLVNADEVRSLLVQVQQQLTQAGLSKGELRPQHSLSINGEDERQAVRSLLERLRHLPAEERQRVPALLNGLGKLQAGAGDFGGAKQLFDEAAQSARGDPARAEVRYNAYRAALEARKWEEALHALREAAELAPQRFALFPLHRYQPRRILGAGGFGTAFLCHDTNFGEDVVVKTLHTADLERGLTDVFREARILRQLSHPAIIGARDCEYADAGRKERPFLVMDYFPGETLEQLIERQGPLTSKQLPMMATPIAQGMQVAHRQNVLHRDLKPSNVLVRMEGERWQVKIIDFGLALRQQAIKTSMAAGQAGTTVLGGSVAGTLKYAPPEQVGELRGVRPGPYSDVYAFGKLCCYALFKTTEPTLRQWAAIPKDLAHVLNGCVEQDLEHRHADFEPVLRVIEALTSTEVKVRKRGQGSEKKRQDLARPATPAPPPVQTGVRPQDQIEAFYKEYKDRHGMRPRAIQAFHEGHDPRLVRPRYGSWLQFVNAMGDLSDGQKGLLLELGEFLKTLETTQMTRSFKMLTLRGMLNRKALPGAIGIKELAAEFQRLALGSAVLRADVGEDLNDMDKLCRYLEKNPIAAWAGGKGTRGRPYFAYEQSVFSSTFTVVEELRPEFQELAREIIEWRLADYLRREEKR